MIIYMLYCLNTSSKHQTIEHLIYFPHYFKQLCVGVSNYFTTDKANQNTSNFTCNVRFIAVLLLFPIKSSSYLIYTQHIPITHSPPLRGGETALPTNRIGHKRLCKYIILYQYTCLYHIIFVHPFPYLFRKLSSKNKFMMLLIKK